MLIPQLLRDKIESLFPKERSTSLRKNKTYDLLTKKFYEMQVNENRIINNVFLFQFPLSKEILIEHYKKSFYEEVFTKKIKADPGEDFYETALLQSDGSYLAGSYPYSYRINPKYLRGELVSLPNVEITSRDFDYTKIKSKKFKKTAKWHAHFMKSLSLNEEYVRQTTSKHYQFESRIVYLSQLKVNIYFVTKGTSEMLELFDQVRKSKSFFLKSLLKTRLDHYYVHNKKEVFEKTWSLESIITKFQGKQKTGEINPESVLILYNDHLYVDSSIDVFLESVQFSFLIRTQFHLELIRRRTCSYRVSHSNGRVFNNLTSINKYYLKSLLYLDNSESCLLSTFDLRNAQPTILANLIVKNSTFIKAIQNSEQKNLRVNLNRFLAFEEEFPEADNFLELCVSGELYETLQEDYRLKKGILLDRDFFKVEMLRLMFSRPNFYSDFIDLESRFKGFKKYIQTLKFHMGYNEYGKNNLAHLLQGTESFIFVESLYNEMAILRIPGTTKHDCLIVPRDKDFKYIKETDILIKKVFTTLNFKGTCSLEHTIIKNFEYPNREEFLLDRWDDQKSMELLEHYKKDPFFKGLI